MVGVPSTQPNPSRARREREREALRETILTTAAEMLAGEGYDAFSLRKLASRIGYSATTIYHHFRDRDALVGAVLMRASRGLFEAMKAVLDATDDPRRRLGEMGKAYVRFGMEQPHLYRLLHLRRPDLAAQGSIDDLTGSTYALLLGEVERLAAQGVLPPVPTRPFADHLWAGVHGLVMLGLGPFGGDRERVEAALRLYDAEAFARGGEA